MHFFPLPKFVIHKIDVLCRTFVWTGKSEVSRKSPVAGKKTCSPIHQGGLSIINMEAWNSIALLKCLWNLCMKLDNLWVKWIHVYYLKGVDVQTVCIQNTCSWILTTIINKRSFVPLIQQNWDAMLTKKRFLMKEVYQQLIDDHSRVDWRHLMRNNYARPRALFTLWLGCHGRLATKDRLAKMDMLHNVQCDMCSSSIETHDHLMFECIVTKDILAGCCSGWVSFTHRLFGGMNYLSLLETQKVKARDTGF